MAPKKKGSKVSTATEQAKAPTQARLELPADEFKRVRAVARSRGLSMAAFIRMAVLKETEQIERGRG